MGALRETCGRNGYCGTIAIAMTGAAELTDELDSTVAGLSRAGPLWQFLSASGASPRSAVEQAELVARLIAELGHLKPTYREVITLAFFDELSTADIAQQLGTTHPAASMLLVRALCTLRRNLTGSSKIGQGDGKGT